MADPQDVSRQSSPARVAAVEQAAVAAQVLRPEEGSGASIAVRPHRHGDAGQPVDARPERTRSRDPEAFPRPTGREEDWRFTPLERLSPLLDGPPSEARLKWSCDLAEGVHLTEVGPEDPLLATVPLPADRVAAWALHRSGGATVLRVAPGAAPAEPVVLRLHGPGTEHVVWGHVVLDVGAQAQVSIVVEHTGSARYGALVSVLAGAGATVNLVGLQSWDDDAVHVAHQAVRLQRDARLRSVQVSLGGDLVRVTETVEYAGPGGEAELLGVYFADAGQHLEHRLLVDHAVPHCRSNVAYKGALQGQDAHTVWVGDVVIRHAAEGTDTYELNRNLVLSDGARADSVPNLEIETGEVVGAGHASATGRFDDEQMFYLQARGIPADEARRLVVRGFFADILARIPVPEVVQRLRRRIDEELERGSA